MLAGFGTHLATEAFHFLLRGLAMNDDNDQQIGLNYELLVEDALRNVVRASLVIAERAGLPGDTHFYISFATNYPGVAISDELATEHPETITIVIQHQYEDLNVSDDHFEITLFFGGRPSPMIVPFAAVTSFNDPSVGFGLQFGINESDLEAIEAETDIGDTGINAESEQVSADVVSLDSFRKNPN